MVAHETGIVDMELVEDVVHLVKGEGAGGQVGDAEFGQNAGEHGLGLGFELGMVVDGGGAGGLELALELRVAGNELFDALYERVGLAIDHVELLGRKVGIVGVDAYRGGAGDVSVSAGVGDGTDSGGDLHKRVVRQLEQRIDVAR